jgi:hypothetical protein
MLLGKQINKADVLEGLSSNDDDTLGEVEELEEVGNRGSTSVQRQL